MNREELFSGGQLDAYLTQKKNEMVAYFNKLDDAEVLNSNTDKLVKQLTEHYQVKPLVLKDSDKYVRVPDRQQSGGQAGQNTIEVMVPYQGDPKLFRQKPKQFIKPEKPIFADIISDVIILTYAQADYDGKVLRESIEKDMKDIQKNLELTTSQVKQFNESLLSEARSLIENRKDNLRKRQDFLKDLGLPVRD